MFRKGNREMEVKEYHLGKLEETKGILLYGAGKWGKLVLETLQNIIEENVLLKKRNIPILFVDRLRSDYCDIKIIKKTEIWKYPGYDILICAPSAWKEIVEGIEKEGLQNQIFGIEDIIRKPRPKTYVSEHDCFSGEVLQAKYLYYKNRNFSVKNFNEELIIPFVGVCITEKCSLNCEKCIALMPHYKQPKNYAFEEIEPYLERFLASVDSVLEMGFTGGETFLNKEYHKYIEWALGQKKIKGVTIITNATILPDEKMLHLLKHEKVVLILDNYGKLSVKLIELEKIAIKEKIKYCILSNKEWQNVGGLTNHSYPAEKRNEIYRNCSFKDCQLFLNGRLYRCQRQAHLTNLGVCKDEFGGFVDFSIEKTLEERKREIRKLQERETAFLACNFCNDITEKMNPVPVAVQIKR